MDTAVLISCPELRIPQLASAESLVNAVDDDDGAAEDDSRRWSAPTGDCDTVAVVVARPGIVLWWLV